MCIFLVAESRDPFDGCLFGHVERTASALPKKLYPPGSLHGPVLTIETRLWQLLVLYIVSPLGTWRVNLTAPASRMPVDCERVSASLPNGFVAVYNDFMKWPGVP